jgi:palmitoyltransferase
VILLPEINSLYGFVNLVIFQGLAFMAIASHLRTMLTDPVTIKTN